jgi:putative DNA primase/helicase
VNIKAEDLVYGRWPEILSAAGMDSRFFNLKNGPCPFCGGSDRFRWAKKNGGCWVCNQCTEGRYASGFRMLMDHMGYRSFREAADHVRSYFGAGEHIQAIVREARTARGNEMSPDQAQRNLQRIMRFWDEGRSITRDDPVDRYLRRRVPGLDVEPYMLRYHPALEYWAPPEQEGGKPVSLGKHPAMLALALDVHGDPVQLHKTFLTPAGEKAAVPLAKKTDYGLGITSFAIRMMEPVGDTLGVCEGIETGLAAVMLRRIPVWPCLNGPAMAQFQLPEELKGQIRRLVIFADHDERKRAGVVDGVQKFRRPGSFYAEQLAQRVRKEGVKVLVIKAASEGQDMANQWIAQCERSHNH